MSKRSLPHERRYPGSELTSEAVAAWTPEGMAAELREVEEKAKLRRRWAEDGAANVYFRSKATLAAVGSDVLAIHRFRHHRHDRGACGKLCEARDLYAFCLLCLPLDLSQRAMPIRPLVIPLIEKFLKLPIKLSGGFHWTVWRDRKRLRAVLETPALKRTKADRRLALRYAGVAAVMKSRAAVASQQPEVSAQQA
jgi:hypothetical protein